MTGFTQGDVVSMREIWRGRIWAARPMIVVRDDSELQAFWFPRGTAWKAPRRASDHSRMRVPLDDWDLADLAWDRNDNLILTPAGAAHAVHCFFEPGGALKGWYVNLQEPLRRTSNGFDTMDLALDVLATPDLSRWEWKDIDDLAEFVAHGLLAQAHADEIHAEGERVIAQIEARAGVFAQPWPRWRPDSQWPLPVLPEGWDAV